MNEYRLIAAGFVAAAACVCAPAIAHGDGGGWSVTIESQPRPYYSPYSAPPPVFYPQAPFPYGEPPSAFVPVPPPVYQYQYRYQYQDPWPGQHRSGDRGGRDGDWRDGERRGQQWRRDGDDNNRPGANNDLPRWGYREGQRRR